MFTGLGFPGRSFRLPRTARSTLHAQSRHYGQRKSVGEVAWSISVRQCKKKPPSAEPQNNLIFLSQASLLSFWPARMASESAGSSVANTQAANASTESANSPTASTPNLVLAEDSWETDSGLGSDM